MSDPRRWTLYCNHDADGWSFDAHGIPLPVGERVDVMPVTDHDNLYNAARRVLNADATGSSHDQTGAMIHLAAVVASIGLAELQAQS